MDTSTPIRTDNMRRHTLLMRTENVSSPLRRSINSSMNTSAVEIPNDDDQRADRRSQLQIQKRLSTIPTAKPVNLNESFIKEQFIMYTHLFTENKITTKNAWKLQIIDMLRPLCQKSRQDVLQIASTSIDISAKVYGIRVDDVHSEGLKLATNMARVADAAPTDQDGGEQSEGEQEVVTAKKKKRRRPNQTGVKSTINKNAKGNLGKLPKLEPTDFTTRVNADTGTIDNLFTNILKETPNSFILLDKTKKFIAVSDPVIENEQLVSLKRFNFPEKISNINPPFSDFVVDVWDPDQEENQLDQERSLLSQIQPVVYDDNGFPIPELDGSCNDIFECNDVDMDNNDGDVEMRLGNTIAADLRGGIAHVVDFTPVDSTLHSSEYSFNPIITTANGKYIDQIWAGPSHWKLKVLRRSVPRFSGQVTTAAKAPQRGKRKHQPEMIDLNAEYPDIDTMPKLVIKKRPPVVEINKITLPLMDQSCARIMTTIKELMLKPGVCPVEKKNATVTEGQEDYEVSPYKYENPNDSLYCSHSQPNNDDNDNDDMDDNRDDNNFEEHVLHQSGNLAENLVDNPEMVPNTYIQYASKAKQIDMKKLKTAIWYKLTNNKGTQQTQNKVIPQTFSELYKAVPDLLPGKEKEKLSCPLAFFALLHLANEQNLYLQQLPDNKDCHIVGPEYYI